MAPTLIPSMMCWKSSIKLGSESGRAEQGARGFHQGYFFGCSPEGTPCGCPVVAADWALLLEPTGGVRVVVGIVPGAGCGAVLPSGRAVGDDGSPAATITPSGYNLVTKSHLPPFATCRTTAGFNGLPWVPRVMSPGTPW